MNPLKTPGGRSNKRHGNPGNLAALKRRLWRAFCEAEEVLDLEDITPELRLKAISTMGTLGAVYAKLLEAPQEEHPRDTLPGDIILIRSTSGSNGHHAD